jgi:diacylglycerol kinase (CTP)
MESKLKTRSDMHLARKFWHVGMVSLMALIYNYAPNWVSMSILVLAILSFIPLDLWRQANPEMNQKIVKMFRLIIRENEVNRLAGTTYLLAGTALIVFIFPKPVVVLTLLFLALADPLASYVGIKYGTDKIFGSKSLQGSMAAFFVCSVTTALFLTSKEILLPDMVVVSLICGLIGAVAELVPIFKLDDNFTLPVISATCIWIVFYSYGAFA